MAPFSRTPNSIWSLLWEPDSSHIAPQTLSHTGAARDTKPFYLQKASKLITEMSASTEKEREFQGYILNRLSSCSEFVSSQIFVPGFPPVL